jgi:hypothetical protein
MADTNAWWIKTSVKPDGTVVKRTLVYIGGGRNIANGVLRLPMPITKALNCND